MDVRRAFLIFCLIGCKPSIQDPVLVAYERFVTAVQAKDAPSAYGMLSAQTKKQLEKALDDVSKAGGEKLIDDVSWLTFASGIRPQEMKELRLVEKQQERATISALVGGQLKTQQLVLEEGQWKVDWTSVLHP